ncbi:MULTISPECIES: flagellar type III secretion system pore protein FliP [unclassified Ectothiorhodospira]|uniref:flagellar type III secretion system pore protein FliP n=1 Tax=unclassified Ectothiorhodospira TaxID=2684909 RepID=UPI001EE8FFBD|nr:MULTISPECIES: flagellar type III secretion system pore protein FliP [unclassified Ectothiorhodospira]MCG5515000.1 flagellar type III secretion system pore protein FliP [Ectothiorhodospira sp. 9100]MCG5517676.1 flagellar type III secretion system pore protein FliP [Ectothiorhodospira sp. 9905]
MKPRVGWALWLPLLALLPLDTALAQAGFDILTVEPDANGGETYSVTLQILILMTLMSLLPAALIMLTSFTRIIIVLGILRQGIGTTQTPSNQILIGLALFLTLFIMAPVFQVVNEEAIQPFVAEEISQEELVQRAWGPMRDFMLEQTRETDIAMFARIGGYESFETPEDVPFSVLVPSFVTSELKTAFQIGFLILIPFLIIDLVVASVLMSMGMMMLSPLIISLPFKIMLFVLVDGWALIMGTLATSFFA